VVQVGATVSYHNPMDEKSEPSWTIAIRTAVKEFVEAVSDSSRQLANASEQFAVQSLQAMEAARARSEQSAEASAEMARKAQQAADEARGASLGLQSAVEEAREQVRNEARETFEQVASQTAHINEIGAQVKYDLQQRIDEMVARLEAGTAGHQEALETAQAATTAAQAAADRIEGSVNAIESAVASARQAAEEARSAAEQSVQSVGNATMAVASAQEAAESSRQSASLAEQAGQRSDFAAEASMLLERLETDYSLLTRLVQELHTRISSLSTIGAAQAAVPASEKTYAEPPIEAYEEDHVEEAWQEPEIAYTAFEAESFEVEPEGPRQPETMGTFGASGWPSSPPASIEETEEATPVQEAPGTKESFQAFDAEPKAPEPAPAVERAPMAEREPEAAMPVPAVSIFGRVQMTISPVPDFDRLLSLDSALARVAGVHSVTLADYAHEEVVFRVELEKPMSVAEFAHQLSETAGVSTNVLEASESAVSIRIG
jgi:hypothetical protein